jgi:hypothetical protein
MISLKQLIQTASYPEDVKAKLLEKVDTLSPEKVAALSENSWKFIFTEFQNNLNFELQKMTLEMAKQEKTYSKEDFDKVENGMFDELLQKLDAVGNEDKIEEVRKQLEVHAGVQSVDQNTAAEPTNPDNNSSPLQ